jgi:hypothetical protein
MTDDIPAKAVEAAALVRLRQYDGEYDASHLTVADFAEDVAEMLTAAAPHIRADERARVVAEVDAALDDNQAMTQWAKRRGVNHWRAYPDGYLRDVLGTEGGDDEAKEG